MTLKNCKSQTAGAIVGRTPFLLFIATWNTELKNSKGEFQSKQKAIEKMNNILMSSLNAEKINRYDSEESKGSRLVGTGEIRLDKIMKPSGDGLYSMLFASTFHPEYIYAC